MLDFVTVSDLEFADDAEILGLAESALDNLLQGISDGLPIPINKEVSMQLNQHSMEFSIHLND